MGKEKCETTDSIINLWLTNYKEYAKAHLKIQDTDGNLLPFILNDVQSAYEDIVEDIKKSGRLVRVVLLKYRRGGFTTDTAGRFFWKVSTRPNTYAMMIAHEPDASNFIYNMHRRFLLNSEWKPQVKYSNSKLLEFNRPDGKPGGLDSAIRVATAGKDDVGSGQLVNLLHCSETSKWPAHTADAIFTSVLQCVPSNQESEVIVESTARGLGGTFYKMYWDSRFKYDVFLNPDGSIGWKCRVDEKQHQSNSFSSLFFPWFVFSKYSMPVAQWEKNAGVKFVRTQEEDDLVGLYFKGVNANAVDRKLCWRRWAIPNLCGGSIATFNQEYPASAMDAFIGTGSPVFDGNQVRKLIDIAPEPIAKYEILPATGMFVFNKEGRLWVWNEPDPARNYIIGADVAEGIEIGSSGDKAVHDFSCASIIDHLTGEQVAEWHGKIDPDLFGQLLVSLGKRYNNAILAPERNNHGFTVVTRIMNSGYTRMFVERIPDPPNKPRKRWGWLTTSASKPEMIDGLIGDMRDNVHGIKSKRVFEEMLSYKSDDKGKYGAEVGMHDDALTAEAIAKRVRQLMPFAGSRRRGSGSGVPGARSVPSMEAFS